MEDVGIGGVANVLNAVAACKNRKLEAIGSHQYVRLILSRIKWNVK